MSHKIRNSMARTKAKPKKRAKLQQVSKTNADKLQAKKTKFSTDNFMPCVSNALEVLLMGDDNSVSLDESSCNASMKVFTLARKTLRQMMKTQLRR